jgi:Ras family protein A
MDQPYVFEIRSRKGKYRFEFHDTSSPETWRLLEPNLVVICFDISQRLSLINLTRVVCCHPPPRSHCPRLPRRLFSLTHVLSIFKWVKEFRTTFPAGDVTPMLVLGLKRDLRSETDPNGIIYPQEAYAVAQQMRADKYMECSAVTGELLPEAFDDICRTAVESVSEHGGQSEGGCQVM